ncbi:MAG: 23S rRNA (guanosine(2251)-2'-O)-methyltransferase RlmB [Sulfurospirillum sp.]|nr:23S rRNA (guanosine(2251)-2'-O)-methyltransferase RlmB [Sulfurospirillum sp.]
MIIYGKQLFLHVLKKYPDKLIEVYLPKQCDQKLFNQIKKTGAIVINVDNKKAQALAKGGNHQGFLALIEDMQLDSFDSVKKGNFLIALDGLSDVGNIGAIIRSAYIFGADALIISGIKSVNIEALMRTSSAAAFELPICLYPNTLDMLHELKQIGFGIYGADMDGEALETIEFTPKKVVVMGSEGEGLSQKIIEKLDKKIAIKMARVFDSLNVSAAAAIICNRIANG